MALVLDGEPLGVTEQVDATNAPTNVEKARLWWPLSDRETGGLEPNTKGAVRSEVITASVLGPSVRSR